METDKQSVFASLERLQRSPGDNDTICFRNSGFADFKETDIGGTLKMTSGDIGGGARIS